MEMDHLFDRFAGGFGLPALGETFAIEPAWQGGPFTPNAPPVDITEDEKAYRIAADLPGLNAKDVEVSISGDALVLKGEKTQEHEEKDKNYHLSERSFGEFERSFALPDGIDRDRITAEFSKGVLTLVLPKTPEQQKHCKKIEVRAS
jgi:HSP20 family protein